MEYVKGVTSADDLYRLCDRLNIKIDGILLLEEFKKIKNRNSKTYIVLLGEEDIGHWVLYDRDYYFDSFGLPPFHGVETRDFNSKQYQNVYGEFCGPYCLLYLYCKQKNRMDLLNRFRDLDVDII